jgi:hypothetical protein
MENINIKSDKGQDFIDKFIKIQTEIYVPKNRKVGFGQVRFSYRSVEDIYDALKKLSLKYGLLFVVSDEIVNIEGKFFVRATAKITNGYDSCRIFRI